MNKSTVSVWNSLSIWTRLAIVWSNHVPYKPFLIFRFISLFQTLDIMLQNIQANIFQSENFLYILKGELQVSLIQSFWSRPWVLLSIISVYFLVVFVMTISTICHLKKENVRQYKSAKWLGLLTNFHSEVLYYPINKCFSELLKNLEDSQLEIREKGAQLSIILVLLCLNVFLTFFKIIFCYCRIRASKLITRKGSLHLVGIAGLKLFLPIFQGLVTFTKYHEEGTRLEIVSVVISFAVSSFILVYTFFILPEYDLVIIKMQITFHSIFVGVCVSQIAEDLVDNKGIILNITFLLMPFWVKLNINLFQFLIKRLKFYPKKSLNHYHSLHLEVIYKDIYSHLTYNVGVKKFPVSVFESEWLNYHVFENFDFQKGPMESGSIDFEKRSKFYLKDLFQKLLDRNPTSVLTCLAYAKFNIKYFSFFSKAYYLCLQASKQRISIPDRVSVYHVISNIEARLNQTMETDVSELASKSMWRIFEYDLKFQNLKSRFSKYIEQSISFWQTLQEENPDLLVIRNQTKELDKNRIQIEATWKTYGTEFLTEFPLVHFLYGVFKAQFFNMPWEGAQHIEKYNCLMKNRSSHSYNKIHFSSEYGTIMISGERKNLGEIIYCSDLVTEIFVIEKKSLLKRNVSMIMPRFFQDKHYLFLLNQYENGKNKILWERSFHYGKDSNNNIFPISLLLGIHLDLEKGIIYTAIIKKIQDKNEYILFKDDGFIEETSVGIRQMCGVEPYKKISVNSVCLDFDFEKYKQCLKTKILDQNKEKISTRVKNSPELRKDYATCELSQKDKLESLEDILKLEVYIKRYLYCNEVLNVMTLEFKSDAQSRIREMIISTDLRKNSKKDLEILTTRGLLLMTSRSNRYLRSKANDTNRKNSEYDSARRILGEQSPDLIHPSDPAAITSYNNQLDSEKRTPETLIAFKKGNDNFSPPTIQNSSVDNLQKTFSKPHHNRFKNAFIPIFFIILVMFLVMVCIQYMDLQDSIQEITFSIGAIRTTYERLTSLSLIWWYANAYEIRLLGLVKATTRDLDRFKLRLRTKRDEIKLINENLMNIITTGQEYQQQRFFRKDIRITYDNNSDIMYQREMNSFEAIHIFIEKLTKFDVTPHSILLQNGNPDLEFVKNNIINDLLVSSEEIVRVVLNAFTDKIHEKTARMRLIFFLNFSIAWLVVTLVLLAFYMNHRLNMRLANALVSIHPRNIELIIYKLTSFNNLLRKKENVLPKALHNFHSDYTLSSVERFRNFKLINPRYKKNGIILAQMKQIFLLLILICCISAVSSIRYVSSNALLDEALVTNNQIIFASKTRHMMILGFATLIELVRDLNTTTVRNQRMDTELVHIIDDFPSSNIIFDEFANGMGQFKDPSIETLFKRKSCSLVVNFPGSLNDINCPAVTQNESIGLLAVYSYSREELYRLSRKITTNLTMENSKEIFIYLIDDTAPRINTLNGGFMFLIDILSQKLEKQILELLEDAKSKLILQILLIIFLNSITLWYLIKKSFDDSTKRIILKNIPFEEISKNKLLKSFIKELYKEKIDSF